MISPWEYLPLHFLLGCVLVFSWNNEWIYFYLKQWMKDTAANTRIKKKYISFDFNLPVWRVLQKNFDWFCMNRKSSELLWRTAIWPSVSLFFFNSASCTQTNPIRFTNFIRNTILIWFICRELQDKVVYGTLCDVTYPKNFNSLYKSRVYNN